MSQINIVLGFLFFLASLLISSLNDSLSKYLYISSSLDNCTLIFFRYFFAVLSICPFVRLDFFRSLKTEYHIHLLRGLILVAAIFFWNIGLRIENVGTATLMSLTEPMFVLFLSPIILRERNKLGNWLGTFICLMGAMIATSDDIKISLNTSFKYLTISVCLFAILDILFKKFKSSSSFVSTIFFTSLVPAILFMPFANFSQLDMKDLGILLCLGVGNNLLIFFMLKAYRYVSIVDLAPFKYFEVVMSVSLGYLFFDEVPSLKFFIGGILILLSLFFFIYYRKKR